VVLGPTDAARTVRGVSCLVSRPSSASSCLTMACLVVLVEDGKPERQAFSPPHFRGLQCRRSACARTWNGRWRSRLGQRRVGPADGRRVPGHLAGALLVKVDREDRYRGRRLFFRGISQAMRLVRTRVFARPGLRPGSAVDPRGPLDGGALSGFKVIDKRPARAGPGGEGSFF